jgi:hypothetical protein
MLKQIIHKVFKTEKKALPQIISDINSFYEIIATDSFDTCDWDFDNLISGKYWLFLDSKYKGFKTERDFIQQGILTMLLFLVFQLLENRTRLSIVQLKEIKKSIYNFKNGNAKSIKLFGFVQNAINLAELKTLCKTDKGSNEDIYRSISWTLQNIILINQRIPN